MPGRVNPEGEKMKKFSLISLACAAALVICPAALVGQQYNFTATGVEGNGQDISITAVLTLTSLGGGEYLLTGATGSVLDPWGNTDTITGVATGYVDPFGQDNLVTIPAAFAAGGSSSLFYFDGNGILLTTNAPGYDVGVSPNEYYQNGNYQFADNGLNGSVTYPIVGNWPYNTTDVTVSLTPVPEGGASSLYLLLAGGACFGAMFFFPRSRFADLA